MLQFLSVLYALDVPLSVMSVCGCVADISVFGIVVPPDSDEVPQISEYSIDGGPSKLFSAPSNGDAPESLPFYAASGLPAGQHTLTILNQGDNFVLEHFEVSQDDSTSTQTSSTAFTKSSQGINKRRL